MIQETKLRAIVFKSTDATWPKWGVAKPGVETKWFASESEARQEAANIDTAKPIIAYDYEHQKWLVGTPEAKTLRRNQASSLLALLKSPTGLHYCQFAGIDDQATLIKQLETELTTLQ